MHSPLHTQHLSGPQARVGPRANPGVAPPPPCPGCVPQVLRGGRGRPAPQGHPPVYTWGEEGQVGSLVVRQLVIMATWGEEGQVGSLVVRQLVIMATCPW